jgi:AcrR family transcriptional regulator
MPLTERRTRRRLALRESIVEAAHAILRDEGLGALTMRRIADAVDYAPASLYAHFANREALLTELCRQGMASLRLALEEAIAGVREPRARLVALARGYVRYALERPETFRLMFMENGALTKQIFEAVGDDDGLRALGLIGSALGELRACGAIRKSASVPRLTDLVWTFVHGIATLRLGCPSMPSTADADLIATGIATIVDGAAPRAAANAR